MKISPRLWEGEKNNLLLRSLSFNSKGNLLAKVNWKIAFVDTHFSCRSLFVLISTKIQSLPLLLLHSSSLEQTMAGNPQVPPDGFFPTRRNPHPQCDHESFHHQFPSPPQNPAFQDSRPMNPPHNNNRSVFFKTRPCKQFEKGECPHGKFCTFAHGPGDLRQPPPNWQEMVARERFGDSQGQKHKICNNFYKGEGCAYGDNCTFLHVKKEVGPQLWDSQASNCTENLGLALARPFGGIGNSNDQKTGAWKTKPCYKYEKFGRCVNGDDCQYAHEPAGTFVIFTTIYTTGSIQNNVYM